MDFVVVSVNEWLYPDRIDYETGTEAAAVDAAKNSYACFQVLLYGIKNKKSQKFAFQSTVPECSVYELVPVMVEGHPNMEPENYRPHYPERKAPYRLFDCMRPCGGTVSPCGESPVVGLYVAIPIPENAKNGIFSGTLTVTVGDESADIPYSVTVYNVTIPQKPTMKVVVGYDPGSVCEKHGVEYLSPEYLDLETKYLEKLRHMRQNMLYTPWMQFPKDRAGNWVFDFTETERYVKKALGMGFEYFFIPDVGKRKSWKGSTILLAGGQVEAMSYEGYRFLAEYMLAWKKFLTGNGWLDRFYMGVSDEPNEYNATEFRALCGLMKRFFPEIKLIDASSYGDLHGALDVWVPLNADYDKHRQEYETFRCYGEEIWFYVCLWPREEGYINRFMDYPLLSTRYLFWGNFRYDLKGFLHWASNFYQPGQDPYRSNCPEHHNADSVSILPPGDTHILYPGAGDAYLSLRLEAQRAGEEDYELLKLAAAKNPALAAELCGECFQSFQSVEYDIRRFENCRKKILLAAENRAI